MTRATVIKAHQPGPGPALRLRAGDLVQLGDYDTEYPEWRWVVAPDSRGGWIHESLLTITADRTTAACDYDATELSAVGGETIEILRSLGGWIECRSRKGEVGWIPGENVSYLSV